MSELKTSNFVRKATTWHLLYYLSLQVFSYKEEPGISDFADNLEGLHTYVHTLVTMATIHVPQEKHRDTVLYFMATAGRYIDI